MSRLSLRSSVALLAGIAVTFPGVAYAVPNTPTPTPTIPTAEAVASPTPSITSTAPASPTPAEREKAVKFTMAVTRQPQHRFDHARVEVTKPVDATFVITTIYGHRERLHSFETTKIEFSVPAPRDGWKPGREYTVVATPEKGSARQATVRLRQDAQDLDFRVAMSRPAKPNDPLGIQLNDVKVGDRILIVVTASEYDGTFVYIQTTATSTSPRWSIRSGDQAQVSRRYQGRWDPELTYTVTVMVGDTGVDAPSWNQTFQVAESGKRPTPKPTQSAKPGERGGGLAATGW